MNRRRRACAAIAVLLLAGPPFQPKAQSDEDVTSAILSLDGRFWQAYNTCDTAAFRQFFTEDVEFYHDKGGPTLGVEPLTASMKSNLCAEGPRLRREAVDGTVHAFPLRNQSVVYGAVLSGEHRFYVLERGKPERLDGQARFVNLWLLRDGAWRMARVLSYDHGPAPYANKRTTVKLPDTVLDSLVGRYRAPQSGTMSLRREDGTLILAFDNGDKALTVYPEAETLFFAKDRDLTFEFVRGTGGKLTMRVREGGTVVEEAVSAP